MRLLHTATASDGKLRWTEDYVRSQDIPPYAILSHTWGEQEVIFDDLKSLDNTNDIGPEKEAGWDKIRFCARQAERDGLDYFWVDTCCIDKTNSQELQEAINSMFCWYQNAEKCYVLLSDVENNSLEGNGSLRRRWKAAFRKSRWFNRGWTLQELLAPRSVEFFSREGELLGDKQSLKDTISRENARDRLRSAVTLKHKGRSHDQEERLGKICSWLSAPDPSTNYNKAHKQRQANTGLWLLESAKFSEWKERTASRLWLYGIPGCGKTILSSTIIENLLQYCHDDTNIVTAYFYFDFNDTQKQDPELMLRSLLCQLLQRSVVIPKGVDALFSSCENGQRKPSSHALLQVTKEAAQEFTHVYVVLDALDECAQRSELMDMLEAVAAGKSGISSAP
ncbi:unnamed protein product [Alternaria alternata]